MSKFREWADGVWYDIKWHGGDLLKWFKNKIWAVAYFLVMMIGFFGLVTLIHLALGALLAWVLNSTIGLEMVMWQGALIWAFFTLIVRGGIAIVLLVVAEIIDDTIDLWRGR